MASSRYYQDIISRTAKRSVEATVSMLGITDQGLRQHLVQELSDQRKGTGFLADSVFEHLFPWEQSTQQMKTLSGNLLLPSLINAMDKAGDHRFGEDWYPFKHQMSAWNTLLTESNKSLVVTSGTGSGKTECFMVPILNDLAQEYEQDHKQLMGVRALLIYPLNALINSQRDRLRAWTEAYDDGLRFCLYNGNTQENKHRDQGKYANEILTRKVMRDQPAPILVTNSTMLEYMLVRQIDEPILQKSQGKLRWIVLDEAHSYVGSQAAELSLLLRRVMHAFGVEAKDVRFVATSATMGGDNASRELQEYLAKIAGIDVGQVVVIGGKRSVPPLVELPSVSKGLAELTSIDPSNHISAERFNALAANSTSKKLRTALTEVEVPVCLNDLTEQLFSNPAKIEETLAWIDICSVTSKPGPNLKNPDRGAEAFLPVRGHLFHQVLSGLWCCADKNCHAKSGTKLTAGWPFGLVYCQRRNHCDCGAPVFELLFCNDCNEPHLMAVRSGGRLSQLDREAVDEFSLDYESAEEGDPDVSIDEANEKVVIAARQHGQLTYPVSIDAQRLEGPAGMETLDLNIIDPNNLVCVACEYSGFRSAFYRRSLLGTPFYISNTVPVLLDVCQESEQANDRPSRGRRLITFTDSRQGTARISTKIQQDSERDSIRGLIYGTTANNVFNIAPVDFEEKTAKLVKYQKNAERFRADEPDIAADFDVLAKALSDVLASSGITRVLTWDEAVSKFQTTPDISRWIFDYYKNLNPELFSEGTGVRTLVEMLLLREFSRRPKRQNSMETLGLVSVQYPALRQITTVPGGWGSLGLSLDDWLAFLKVALDFYVRENSIIDIPADWVDWMGAKIYPKTVINPLSDESTSSRIFKWPRVVPGRNNRLIRMLCLACDLDVKNPADKDLLNGLLLSAWNALTKQYQVKNEKTEQVEIHQILVQVPGSIQYHLARSAMAFTACAENWVCPVTHRLLDSTFKAITPYLPFNLVKEAVICSKQMMPVCQLDASQFATDLARKQAIRAWVKDQPGVESLRRENLWTDISDRVVEGSGFFRAVEHSAQQPASTLERYEALFKLGKLNVLNCSTTMEMGVDIGGISIVAMNNVPPHPANYLQRSGRAGRRGETQALSFTICKDNPHERSVFANPLWPFTTSIAAPYVTLNSERIVQRHINSLLLSYFLKSVLTVTERSITSLNSEWFFASENADDAPVEKMLRWLNSFLFEKMPESVEMGVKKIVKDSVLSSISKEQLVAKSSASLTNAKTKWLPGFEKIQAEFMKVEGLNKTDPYRRKVAYDLKCMGEQYLLGELASKAFLPAYGFPTGIATFDHYSVADYIRGKYVTSLGRIDNQTRMRERPGRDMAIAIREYAPGSDVVLDGLVYRSAGILLNRFSPNEEYSEPQTMMKEWRCQACGFIGNESGATFDDLCSECGMALKQDNVKEYIEPLGFAVDFYSSPTTDISAQMFIAAQDPWVTAHAPLQPLFEPKLGAYRQSPQGHIFNHSSGEHGHGFAICLRCGKAASMLADHEFPAEVQSGKQHKKLQGKPGAESSAWCEGPEEAYAIKGNLHLGATDQTDVFELYLKHPVENRYFKHSKGDPLPWTLAVVLRQALADIHGVNATEMGYTINPSDMPDCDYPVAGIVLFDNCGGGAGFSSSAARHLHNMFAKALKHLDCEDNCDSACQSCLMGYDTRFHMDLLDRHVAIAYINSILPYLTVADDAKVLGERTRYCFESLSAEILADAAQGCETLRLFVSGAYSDWDIGISDLKEACLSWRQNFDRVEIVMPSNDLAHLSDIHKEDLHALSVFGIKLVSSVDASLTLLQIGCLLAQVVSDDRAVTYATNRTDATVPNSQWWLLDDSYLVKSHDYVSIETLELDTARFTTQKSPGDVEIELLTECNGPLREFGEKFWKTLTDQCDSLAESLGGSKLLKSMTYSDSYICNPWSLMLIAEIIDALKQQLGSNWESPALGLVTGNKPVSAYGKGLYAEWASSQLREDVIAVYFDQMGESLKVDIRPMNEVPHGRTLSLCWGDETVTSVRLDHGVGCWSIDGKSSQRLDVSGAPVKQVSTMYEILKDIHVKYSKNFVTQIFVKNRVKV